VSLLRCEQHRLAELNGLLERKKFVVLIIVRKKTQKKLEHIANLHNEN
jgi:hypothetical protein